MTITQPMLAASTSASAPKLEFPVLGTPKVDGIRALKVGGRAVSRSFKLIPNSYIRLSLESLLPEGADGEIVCGDSFYSTTSAVMSCCQDETKFSFFWFDWVYGSPDAPYYMRVERIYDYALSNGFAEKISKYSSVSIVPMLPKLISDKAELYLYEAVVLRAGFEGLVLRKPDGHYKFGRSTLGEGLLVKMKRHEDSEALIVGTEELMHNEDEVCYDSFGKIKRRHRKEHLAKGGALGAIVARARDGAEFKIGTGYTGVQRMSLWKERDTIMGKMVKYRHAKLGHKLAPRSPVFIGIRCSDDF